MKKHILVLAAIAALSVSILAQESPSNFHGKGVPVTSVIQAAANSGSIPYLMVDGGLDKQLTFRINFLPKRDLPELCSLFAVKVETDREGTFRFTRDLSGRKVSPIAITEAESAKLRGLPPVSIEMKEGYLAVAIQMLAETAGQDYIFEPSTLSDLVTISEVANPWIVLEKLCTDHGVKMTKTRLGWVFTKGAITTH